MGTQCKSLPSGFVFGGITLVISNLPLLKTRVFYLKKRPRASWQKPKYSIQEPSEDLPTPPPGSLWAPKPSMSFPGLLCVLDTGLPPGSSAPPSELMHYHFIFAHGLFPAHPSAAASGAQTIVPGRRFSLLKLCGPLRMERPLWPVKWRPFSLLHIL